MRNHLCEDNEIVNSTITHKYENEINYVLF